MTNTQFTLAAKALSDPTRLQILQIVSKSGNICACKILEELHISQGTLSHHMKILTNLKLVSVERNGKWCHYSLISESMCEISRFIQAICKDGKEAIVSCDCQ